MATVATTRPPPAEARLSPWEQFDALPDDTKAELIDGELVYAMPASRAHNRVVGLVYATLLLAVCGQAGERPRLSPISSRCGWGLQRFVPDASFVRTEHLDRVLPTRIEGPADLVVEVLSPDSVARDRGVKLRDYAAAGVQEYWLLDPEAERIEVYGRQPDGAFVPLAPDRTGAAGVAGSAGPAVAAGVAVAGWRAGRPTYWRRCGHMASGSRAARLLAWGRLIHPFPVVLKVLACAAFATIATPGAPALVPLVSPCWWPSASSTPVSVRSTTTATVTSMPRSKPSKPLVQGLVRPWQALVVGVATLATGLAATRWLPWPARVSAVVYAAAGVAYDLGLKCTRWSWAPFVVAFPLLPIWSWTAVRGWDRRLRWVYPVGAPLVLGIHLANTLPDLAADRRSGVQGLAHRLGPRWSRRVCWGGYLVAQGARTRADAPRHRPGQSRPRRRRIVGRTPSERNAR